MEEQERYSSSFIALISVEADSILESETEAAL
jgi:hypothetical protein